MLLQTLSKFFQAKSQSKSETKSSESSALSASSPARSQESSSSPNWIAKATNQIKREEGEVLHAYQDHLGYWSIGIGRLIDKRKGGGISKEEAEYMLKNDVTAIVQTLKNVYPWFEDLDDARKAVMVNMAFQLGLGGLSGFKNTLAYIEAGDYENAAANMLKSLWAKQTPERAKRMAAQMRSGQWAY